MLHVTPELGCSINIMMIATNLLLTKAIHIQNFVNSYDLNVMFDDLWYVGDGDIVIQMVLIDP